MSEVHTLTAERRDRAGKGAARSIRRAGRTPAVIYGNKQEPILISLDLFDHDAYGIMEERQLRRYGFFRRLGMFSVDRENFRSARRSLDYAATLLRGTGRVLWLFPQGEIVPNDRRPVRCYRAQPACDVELIDDGISEVPVG